MEVWKAVVARELRLTPAAESGRLPRCHAHMNEDDLRRILGEPDRIGGERMTSTSWRCMRCGKVHSSPTPVPVPAPCECGSIAFEVERITH